MYVHMHTLVKTRIDLSVKVCAGAKVLRDWGMLSVNRECLISGTVI